MRQKKPVSSPLDQLTKVIEFTARLRTEKGEFSATRIAEFYGLPPEDLQTLADLPEQITLEFLARIARLGVRFSQPDFQKWLRGPCSLLQDRSPLEVIKEGRLQELADFVEDRLTGAPI